MIPSPTPQSNRKSWLAGLLAAGLLTACSSTFAFHVQSSSPAEVGSAFVLFGKDSNFRGKQRSADIVKLIQPAELNNYAGYTEYKFEFTDTGATWVQLSERLPKEIDVELDPEEPGVLAFDLDRDLLEMRPELGIAIVVRTAQNGYLLKTWEHSIVAEAEGSLIVDVNGTDITGIFK